MGRERNNQGRYADGIDPEKVLDVFDGREDRARPITAGDVVDELGIARRTAHNKLNRLVDREILDTRKVGARGRVWWTPERGDTDTFDTDDLRGDATTTLAGESDDTGAESGRGTPEKRPATTSDPEPSPTVDATPTASTRTDGADPIGDALDGWDPDTETPVETAHAQTRRAAEWLRESGLRHKRSAFIDALADESTLSGRVWWERAVQPGLRRLAEHDLVEYRPGYHDYRYVAPDADAPEGS